MATALASPMVRPIRSGRPIRGRRPASAPPHVHPPGRTRIDSSDPPPQSTWERGRSLKEDEIARLSEAVSLALERAFREPEVCRTAIAALQGQRDLDLLVTLALNYGITMIPEERRELVSILVTAIRSVTGGKSIPTGILRIALNRVASSQVCK